jgi:ATP-dependent DNA helicase RecQ
VLIEEEALELLRRSVGAGVEFRAGQLEAVADLVEGRKRVLVVQRTGWGKSAVYFIATALLRRRGFGCTLLISPLLALMRNQRLMSSRMDVRAEEVTSANPHEWADVLAALEADEVDLLLVSPERLNNKVFQEDFLPILTRRPSLLVIDEVHCISDWGHDFRPDYRRIGGILNALPTGTPVLCTTATANDRVMTDVSDQLGTGLEAYRGSLERESLSLAVVDLPNQADRLAWLATFIPSVAGAGIVYCLTVADTERVASFLKSVGIEARAYNADMDNEERQTVEDALLANRLKVVVATSALGMGFDKPDLAFVVHYQAPGSAIAYYQQVGRAGRALAESTGVLLCGREDSDIQDYFIDRAFPDQTQAERVVELLADRTMSGPAIESAVNIRRSRLTLMFKVLEIEGAIEHQSGGWRRTLKRWSYDADRVARVTAARRSEQAAMLAYQAERGCLMRFLRAQLDDVTTEDCGRCANCTGDDFNPTLDPELVRRATLFLRRSELTLEPRERWPGGLGEPSGAIPADERVEEGRVLSLYGDAGWGWMVRDGKHVEGRFSDDLVVASAEVIRDRWGPAPYPTWLTWVPSHSHPELLSDFASRLGDVLGLPSVEALAKDRETRPQKTRENSAQQVRNIFGAFSLTGRQRSGSVLLVDDIVDSRWTLTIAGQLLRRGGADAVFPFALALAKGK